MVLTRNRIVQLAKTSNDENLSGVAQNINLITTNLQTAVMKTRLQPLRIIGDRLPRIVRDISNTCGKKATIEMKGLDTELDKSLIEAISEPLVHIVRNAVDHGIEFPEERLRRGKPAEGRIKLSASYEGGMVNITIKDDGAGIDLQRLKAAAIRNGRIEEDSAERMIDQELLNLIFQPGFSTAKKVTRISGRGVGMDVVRNRVKNIGGNVQLDSQPGEGTEIKIKLPLTLAILPVLIIESGNQTICYVGPDAKRGHDA